MQVLLCLGIAACGRVVNPLHRFGVALIGRGFVPAHGFIQIFGDTDAAVKERAQRVASLASLLTP